MLRTNPETSRSRLLRETVENATVARVMGGGARDPAQAAAFAAACNRLPPRRDAPARATGLPASDILTSLDEVRGGAATADVTRG